MVQKTKNKIWGWLRLVRAPNLFSVPGDPLMGLAAAALAGAAFPGFWRAAGAAFTALFLYAAGLILNDLHDRQRDALLRPERPLPSGRVTPVAATGVMGLLFAAAFAAAFLVGRDCLLTAAALAGMILIYNWGVKDILGAGALAMGLCRGLSVLLGVPFEQWNGVPLILAGMVTLYIFGLTLISRGEDRKLRYGVTVWIPALALAGFISSLVDGGEAFLGRAIVWKVVSVACTVLALAESACVAFLLYGKDAEPALAQGAVVRLIRQLPVIQCAVLVLLPTTAWIGVALLVLSWTVARPLAKRISGA